MRRGVQQHGCTARGLSNTRKFNTITQCTAHSRCLQAPRCFLRTLAHPCAGIAKSVVIVVEGVKFHAFVVTASRCGIMHSGNGAGAGKRGLVAHVLRAVGVVEGAQGVAGLGRPHVPYHTGHAHAQPHVNMISLAWPRQPGCGRIAAVPCRARCKPQGGDGGHTHVVGVCMCACMRVCVGWGGSLPSRCAPRATPNPIT